MSATRPLKAPAPTPAAGRITNLDAIRGLAVLGILAMNAVAYGLPPAAYFNLDAAGSDSWLDWVVAGAGELFVDQKMMALFSLLFGAGIVLFAERAAAKAKRAWPLSLWRNALLLLIGLLHGLLWDGDVLVVYALCAPLLIAFRRLRPRLLFAHGAGAVLWSAVLAVIVQIGVGSNPAGLGEFWLAEGGAVSDPVGLFLLNEFFFRALGMMLIGAGLYRLGVLGGERPTHLYRALVRYGFAIGLPIAAIGLILQAGAGFGPGVAVIGQAPNTLAAIPMALGYVGLISLWNRRPETRLHLRIRAVGRMALTNYLMQTVLGLLLLRVLLDSADLSRTGVAGVVVLIWAIELAWSKPWLERFRFGPVEWAWRCGTYRRWQPIVIRRQGTGVAGSRPATADARPPRADPSLR